MSIAGGKFKVDAGCGKNMQLSLRDVPTIFGVAHFYVQIILRPFHAKMQSSKDAKMLAG